MRDLSGGERERDEKCAIGLNYVDMNNRSLSYIFPCLNVMWHSMEGVKCLGLG